MKTTKALQYGLDRKAQAPLLDTPTMTRKAFDRKDVAGYFLIGCLGLFIAVWVRTVDLAFFGG